MTMMTIAICDDMQADASRLHKQLCHVYTSDAADDQLRVEIVGSRINKTKKQVMQKISR